MTMHLSSAKSFGMFLLIAHAVLLASALHALDPKKRITQYDLRVYKAQEGLPMNDVKDVFQDSRGYLWVACQEGLVRFDGVHFTLFDNSHNPDFGENFIWDVEEDWEGNLWLATNGGGVKRFDGHGFVIFRAAQDSLACDVVKRILVGRNKQIWFGTEHGLSRYSKGAFTSCKVGDPAGSQEILALHEDRNGDLLVGSSQSGLHVVRGDSTFTLPLNSCIAGFCERASGEIIFNAGLHELYVYHHQRVDRFDPSEVPSAHTVRAIHEDAAGNLWFATEGSGILRYAEGRFEQLKIETGLPQEHNFFMRIMEDREKNLWFVGDGGLLQLKDNRFITFGQTEGMPSNFGHAICQDRAGTMWAGFRDNGLASFDGRQTRQWSVAEGLLSPIVTAVYPARDGGVWIGTPNGLQYFKDGRFHRQAAKWRDSDGLLALFENQAGVLWMGMARGSLGRWDGKEFKTFTLAAPRESGNVIAIIQTANGEVWAGTWKQGLYKLSGNTIHHFTAADSIRADGVNAFYEDEAGVLWIATDGQGLYRYAGGNFVNINTHHGLCFDRLFAILEDQNHDLWVSGNRGIFRVPKQQLNDFAAGESTQVHCQYYNHLDGMRETECNGRRQPVAWKSTEGRLWFVSTAGVVCVDPANLLKNACPPPVYIQEVLTPDHQVFKPEARVIALRASQRELEFRFTALSFVIPERVRFRYRLKGYDQQWIDAGTRREAFYTNLSKGNYTFQVIACNNDGVWNEEGATVQLHVAAHPWETWWAYALYGLVLVAVFFGIRRYDLKRVRLRNQLQLQHVQTEKLQELDRVKSRFFAGISHEFRTPLTLIAGPLQELLERARDRDQKKRVRMMLRNTRRLQHLVDELLELAQLESGKMSLAARPVRVADFLRGIVASFESLAAHKQITLSFYAAPQLAETVLFLDPGKMEKAMVNLLANALKYTSASGLVVVTVTAILPGLQAGAREAGEGAHAAALPEQGHDTAPARAGAEVEIAVQDSGSGIPAQALPHIFDYFYRYRDKNNAGPSGSGIGLALTKELVTLHHGAISVRSQEGTGTAFIIRLPMGKDHLRPEEIAHENLEEPGNLYIGFGKSTSVEELEREVAVALPARTGNENLSKILLVEDNADMRQYLRRYLNHENSLLEAKDGEEGWQMALREIPDLVVSDVMMPAMNGFELCQRLKTNELTNHIPVLLLTARGSGESRIEGLELGADDYLTKPITGRELRLRVKNLIERQNRLRALIRKEVAAVTGGRPDLSAAPPRDKFLQRVELVVQQHLTDPEFGPEDLAQTLAISRPHLNRKVYGVLGQSTGEYIRTMRLKRAAELLRQKNASVSEVAYQAGFNHLSYFARCFKLQYGVSPSEFPTS